MNSLVSDFSLYSCELDLYKKNKVKIHWQKSCLIWKAEITEGFDHQPITTILGII